MNVVIPLLFLRIPRVLQIILSVLKMLGVKSGTKKRLLGAAKAVLQSWETEATVYQNRTYAARQLREHMVDLIELDPVDTEVLEQALQANLRVTEPIPRMDDLALLKALITKQKPFVMVWRAAPLASQCSYGRYQDALCRLLRDLLSHGSHFWLRANAPEDFFSSLEARKLRTAPGIHTKSFEGVFLHDRPA